LGSAHAIKSDDALAVFFLFRPRPADDDLPLLLRIDIRSSELVTDSLSLAKSELPSVLVGALFRRWFAWSGLLGSKAAIFKRSEKRAQWKRKSKKKLRE
jgi:hypothetical protein